MDLKNDELQIAFHLIIVESPAPTLSVYYRLSKWSPGCLFDKWGMRLYMYHDLSFLSELPLKTSVLGTTKKLHQCSGTIEILDKERRDQNVPASPHKGSTTCSGPGNVYKRVFKASVQYFVFFSRSQAVALTVPIFRHTNHSFPYCVFKTRSFDPTADHGCNTPCWSICLTGKQERQIWSSFEILPQTFLQSNSGEHSETLTSFLMRKQTSCLIELRKPEARAKGMTPRWKSMPN